MDEKEPNELPDELQNDDEEDVETDDEAQSDVFHNLAFTHDVADPEGRKDEDADKCVWQSNLELLSFNCEIILIRFKEVWHANLGNLFNKKWNSLIDEILEVIL